SLHRWAKQGRRSPSEWPAVGSWQSVSWQSNQLPYEFQCQSSTMGQMYRISTTVIIYFTFYMTTDPLSSGSVMRYRVRRQRRWCCHASSDCNCYWPSQFQLRHAMQNFIDLRAQF
ncbi:hypothetical protein M5D96_002184, partial [Drosophila gunungcola]